MNKGWQLMQGYTPDWIHDPQQVERMRNTARALAAEADALNVNWKPIAKGRKLEELPEIIIRMRSAINWAELKRQEVLLDDEARRLGVDAILENAEKIQKIKNLGW